MFGPVPLQSVAEAESASWATPQEAEATADEVAFTVPTEVKVLFAADEDGLESSPVGSGDPFGQGCVFEAVTEPPEPVPVEWQLFEPAVVPSSCKVPAEKLPLDDTTALKAEAPAALVSTSSSTQSRPRDPTALCAQCRPANRTTLTASLQSLPGRWSYWLMLQVKGTVAVSP